MKYTLLAIGFLLLWSIQTMAHVFEDLSSAVIHPTTTTTASDICFLLPQYTIILNELENGRYILKVDVSNMGRADKLQISFFYTDFGISEEITVLGSYEIGIIGFEQPRQNGFYPQDNINVTILENSSLCSIQNQIIFDQIILPEIADPAEDDCQLKFIHTNKDNSCMYQEEHWLRTNISSGLPVCNGSTIPNDLWLKIPIPAAGEADMFITDSDSGQPLVVNYDVYKGANCVNNISVLTCQTGSGINVGPYSVGEFLFFRIWLDDLPSDRSIRFCIQASTCNLPTYSINTQKNCTDKTINKTLFISDIGDASSLNIYVNDEIIHGDVTTDDYAIPTFFSCSDAILKIEATNIFCGLIEDITDVCMEEKNCTTAIALTQQQTSNFIYTPATTCGKESNLPECGGFFVYPVEWFKFTALSTNPNLWLDTNFATEVNLYTGDCSGNLQFHACYQQPKGERNKALNLEIGETYYVAIFNTNFSRSRGSVAAFQIAVQSDVALAVEWTDFNGIANSKDNLLQWTINDQLNVAYFLLEKSPTGKNDWEQLARINSRKATSTPHLYSILDNNPYAKTYYRLQTVTTDEHQQVSQVIQVEQNRKGVTIQQIGEQIFIKNITFNNTPLQLQISNSSGQLIEKRTLRSHETNLSIQEWSSGIYFLMVNDEQEYWVEKIIR